MSALALAGAIALGLVVPASAGATPLLRPVVLAARATPVALPLGGGQVLVTGAVKNANSCQLLLLSRQSFPVVYSHNPTTACQGGSFSAHVTYRGQPEPGKAHGGFRPGRPQRDLLVHRALLRIGRAARLAPAVLSAACHSERLGAGRRPGDS